MKGAMEALGFISESGEFIQVDHYYHDYYAQTILQYTSAYNAVVNGHFIHITFAGNNQWDVYDIFSYHVPTQAQLDALADWAEEYEAEEDFDLFMENFEFYLDIY